MDGQTRVKTLPSHHTTYAVGNNGILRAFGEVILRKEKILRTAYCVDVSIPFIEPNKVKAARIPSCVVYFV